MTRDFAFLSLMAYWKRSERCTTHFIRRSTAFASFHLGIGELLMNAEEIAPRGSVISRLPRLRMIFGGLFVLAVLSGLGWAAFGAVATAREAARRSTCTCRLKQIGLALQNYGDVYKRFPAAYTLQGEQPGASWRVQLLPYIEQKAVYDRYRQL